MLRRRRQIADRHVLDHAAAKRTDLSHRKTSGLKGWAAKTLDPLRQEAISATTPQLPRKRLRSIPAESRALRGLVLLLIFEAQAHD